MPALFPRRIARAVLPLLLLLLCSGHIGSPDVWYDGAAGPYSIRVLVRPPKVVPGLADVVVRVRGGASRVLVTPAHGDTGPEGAPPPDVAKPLAADTEVFTAQLWLMARGPYRIIIAIDGPSGKATAVVPVTASATERLPMPRWTGMLLVLGLLFLLAGLISIAAAAARESLLMPGVIPGSREQRRGHAGMAITFVVACVILFGGWKWWAAVDAAHRSKLDRPWGAAAEVVAGDLMFWITERDWAQRTDSLWLRSNARATAASILPDHGKQMHMFVIRDDKSALGHLHPVTRDDRAFRTVVPALPSGAYRIYGDIVEDNGATHTMVTKLELADTTTRAMSLPDTDDALWTGPAVGALTGLESVLDDGSRLRWLSASPPTAGAELEIAVAVVDSLGKALDVDPYMGMAGHAIIAAADDSVFVHLHPLGTISTAAQQAMSAGVAGMTTSHGMHPGSATNVASRISFPYAFPRAGTYRVWVQIKRNGRILTGARDVTVTNP